MASQLKRSTQFARRVLIGFMIFAVVSFLFRLIPDNPLDRNVPVPTPIPRLPYLRADNALGEIPRPEITVVPISAESEIAYSIDERGQLPNFPPVINVYRIRQPRELLGNTEKARNSASRLALPTDENRISDEELLFESTDRIRTLVYNKVEENWLYEVDTQREFLDNDIAQEIRLTGPLTVYNDTGVRFLNSMGLSSDFYTNSNARLDYIKLVNNIETRSSSPFDADYVRIAQFKLLEASTVDPEYKPSQSEEPAVTTFADVRKNDILKGIAHMHVRGDGTELIRDLTYFDYQEYFYDGVGIYPALSSLNAWIKVQAGEGKLIWLLPLGQDPYTFSERLSVAQLNIRANETTVVYFEPEEWISSEAWTHYTQPYYMFQGEAEFSNGSSGDFIVIIEALENSAYQQNENST